MKKCKSCKYYRPATLYSTIGYCRNESSVNFNSLGCEYYCCSHYESNGYSDIKPNPDVKICVESDFDLSRVVDATINEVLG